VYFWDDIMGVQNYKLNYIDLNYKPSNTDIIVEYYLEPEDGVSFEVAAENVALESSIGTWTDLTTAMPLERANKYKPRVFFIDKKRGIIKVAHPIVLFELGNISQLLSAIAGNIFGMKLLKNLRLEDISFPEVYLNSFKGPSFGVQGVRKLVGVYNRPLVGTIIKPKIGLTSKEHAIVAYNAWMGGCDVVKDDENLTNQSFNKFNTRIKETYKLLKKAEKLTGSKKIYLPNVTAETKEMLKRAKFVKKNGGTHVMVDIVTVGFSGLQTLKNECDRLGLAIHAHRAMHAALTRNKKHGISMLVLAKLSRLIGVDQIHIGTIVGKMEGQKQEVLDIKNEMENKVIQENLNNHVLYQDWKDIKPCFVVASGGLHPGNVPDLYNYFGKDVIIQMGGGVHGHPSGTLKGAMAARQAIDAVVKKIPLKKYAETHSELLLALNHWS